MSTLSAVTLWINQLKAGNRDAATKLWDRYFERAARMAARKLFGRPPAAGDGEDAALSALDYFFRRAEAGEMPHVEDRHDLWQCVAGIVVWKVRDRVEKATRGRRGGGAVLNEAAIEGRADCAQARALEQVADAVPAPDVQVMAAEEVERFLTLLGTEGEELRLVAEWRLQGDDNATIQARLGCSPRTVERKLEYIRAVWQKESAYATTAG